MIRARLLVLTTCLSLLLLSCHHRQDKKFNCQGFQDTLLHKFVYKTADVLPQPVGGVEAISKAIDRNFKFPSGDVDFSGKVQVAFVVEPDGTIDGKRTIYDPSGKDSLFSKQLLNILNNTKWKPALCNGTKVPCLYIFPLNITLQD
jgi:hypothetical protein